MKLIVCWGTFPLPMPGGHACERAHTALREAGHEPHVIRGLGSTRLPDAIANWTPGRREAKRRTGSSTVPVLLLDADTAIAGTKEIVAWAKANPKKG